MQAGNAQRAFYNSMRTGKRSRMQSAFLKCKAINRALHYANDYLSIPGAMWLVYDVAGRIVADMSDRQLEAILYRLLYCYELTAEEEREIRQILRP